MISFSVPLTNYPTAPASTSKQAGFRGLAIACGILAVWAVSLVGLISLPLASLNPVVTIAAMLWQTFLYTGLFITAHDAMHGVVFPKNIALNNFIGSLALTVYGLFSFKKLLQKHWQHHHHPASDRDPDFHNGKHDNFIAWYCQFMVNYWSWSRLLGLMVIYNVLERVLHVPSSNLLLFWVIPSLLSSVQLFYFGTFLPHREPQDGFSDALRARSSYRPLIWSFLTCYHFGYHHEHHEFPHVPWWQLPTIVRKDAA